MPRIIGDDVINPLHCVKEHLLAFRFADPVLIIALGDVPGRAPVFPGTRPSFPVRGHVLFAAALQTNKNPTELVAEGGLGGVLERGPDAWC